MSKSYSRPPNDVVFKSGHAEVRWDGRVGTSPPLEEAYPQSKPVFSLDVYGKPVMYDHEVHGPILLVLVKDTEHYGYDWVIRTVLYGDKKGYSKDWTETTWGRWYKQPTGTK